MSRFGFAHFENGLFPTWPAYAALPPSQPTSLRRPSQTAFDSHTDTGHKQQQQHCHPITAATLTQLQAEQKSGADKRSERKKAAATSSSRTKGRGEQADDAHTVSRSRQSTALTHEKPSTRLSHSRQCPLRTPDPTPARWRAAACPPCPPSQAVPCSHSPFVLLPSSHPSSSQCFHLLNVRSTMLAFRICFSSHRNLCCSETLYGVTATLAVAAIPTGPRDTMARLKLEACTSCLSSTAYPMAPQEGLVCQRNFN